MEIREFIDRANAIVNTLAPRIDATRARSIQEDMDAGAWEVGLPELVAVLVHERTPVTTADREELRLLLADVGDLGEDPPDPDDLNIAD